MKTAFAVTLATGLAILAVLTIFFVSAVQDTSALREDNQRLAWENQRLEQHVTDLTLMTNSMAKAASASATPTPATNAPPPVADAPSNSSVMPRAYQVPVTVGGKSVGLGWAVPTYVRRDPKSGRVTFEQVIQLPDEARRAFTTTITNVIERQVAAAPNQVIERDWVVDRRPDWGWWAPWYPAQPDRPSGPSHSRPSPSRPPTVVSGGPWMPVAATPRPTPSPGLHLAPAIGGPGIFVPPGLR